MKKMIKLEIESEIIDGEMFFFLGGTDITLELKSVLGLDEFKELQNSFSPKSNVKDENYWLYHGKEPA
jgi:hypothetical protein